VNYVDYNHVLDTSAAINGDVITSHTLVGYYSSKFPLKNGNCFSMRCNDGNVYRIVNFCYENLIEVTNRGVTLPIKVLPLNGRVAIICDSRIANDWYQDRFCECCCPESLLPIQQRLRIQLEIDCGARENFEKDNGDGTKYVMTHRTPAKLVDLRTALEKEGDEAAQTERWQKAGIIVIE
jgi:hypothetical protein